MMVSERGADLSPAFPPVVADDTALLAAIATHDQVAFAALYDRYSTPAYTLAYHLLGERGVAEDVVQEVFLAIWHRADSCDRARGNVRAWLLTGIRHAAISRTRGKQGRARFDVPRDALAGIADKSDQQAAEGNERRATA